MSKHHVLRHLCSVLADSSLHAADVCQTTSRDVQYHLDNSDTFVPSTFCPSNQGSGLSKSELSRLYSTRSKVVNARTSELLPSAISFVPEIIQDYLSNDRPKGPLKGVCPEAAIIEAYKNQD